MSANTLAFATPCVVSIRSAHGAVDALDVYLRGAVNQARPDR